MHLKTNHLCPKTEVVRLEFHYTPLPHIDKVFHRLKIKASFCLAHQDQDYLSLLRLEEFAAAHPRARHQDRGYASRPLRGQYTSFSRMTLGVCGYFAPSIRKIRSQGFRVLDADVPRLLGPQNKKPLARLHFAGPPGLEPGTSVLETEILPLNYRPRL